MKKVIKLTEADILKLVKNVISEQMAFGNPNGFLSADNPQNKMDQYNKPEMAARFNVNAALVALKKAGYKVFEGYAIKDAPNNNVFIIMFIQGIIDLSFMAKDNAGEYLERGNMENIDEYPHKTLNVGDFSGVDQFIQVVKKFEQYAVAQKPKKYGPTSASDVTAPRQSSLNETIKKYLKEAVAPEPVITGNGEHTSGYFTFAEGKSIPSKVNGQPFDTTLRARIVNGLAKFLQTSVPTMQKFLNDPKFKLPKFIQINVGTSHTASPEANVGVAQKRGEYLRALITDALAQLKIRPDVVYQIVTTNTDAQFQPSKLDTSFYDARVLAPNADERFGEIRIKDLSTQGLDTKGIQNVQHGIAHATGDINNWVVDTVDEAVIVDNIKKLQTYSDVQDLNDAIIAQGHPYGDLEGFLNNQLFDDDVEMTQVAKHLNKCAMNSGLPGGTIRLVRDSNGHFRISINMQAK